MDHGVLTFAQVMAILVPSIAALTGIGVLGHWIVERTNRLTHRTPETLDAGRLQRLEQAVDTIAIEVERLGEGQRFVTKLLVERDPQLHPPELPPRRVITPH